MKRKTMVGVCAVLGVFAVALAVAGCSGLPGARQDGVKSDSSTALLDTQEYNDESDFEVELIDDEVVEIVDYVGEKQVVNIPPVIGGLPVISIGWSAFSGTSLTSVTIPSSVTSIDFDAFGGCTSLTSVTIPSSVTFIGDLAFSECTSLTSVTIPSSVTSIGEWAFGGCESLTSIKVDANNLNYSSEGGILYNKAKTELIAYPSASGNVTIPSGITTIERSAFYSYDSLTSVTIPFGVTSIGHSAFRECTNLTSVIIPSSITSIGRSAFEGCKSLISVNIPSGVMAIDDWTFYGCTSLTRVSIPSNVTSIGFVAFADCIILTDITIPSSVTSIGDYAFDRWTSSQTINIEGHANQTAADAAWGEKWRDGCEARINYRG